MPKEIKDSGTWVGFRLLEISSEKGQNFELVFTHHAIERLLYRVAKSQHVDRFILKGAMLLMTWFDEPFRSTRDLDLLVYGDSTTEKRLPPIGPRSQSTHPYRARERLLFTPTGIILFQSTRPHRARPTFPYSQ